MSHQELQDMLFRSATGAAWKKVGVRHHFGIAIPLFSLRSKKSSGIGEFLDLIPLIDWCGELGLDVIQLLPLNDSDLDPSPYNAQSSCALNPIFLTLQELPYLDKDDEMQKKIASCKTLNSSSKILYPQVRNAKINFLRSYFHEYGQRLLNESCCKAFLDANPWLEPYALFKVLKDKMSQQNFLAWPRELRAPTREEYKKLVEQDFLEVSFYKAVQYLCYMQMKTVKSHAEKRGVFLKGDIPILISPDSADVWHRPELFNFDLAAGAPPDVYNSEGQYWGFPLFNWQAIKKENYSWWKQRIRFVSEFYDLYRLDHVIGLFRIWAIPLQRPPKEGHFIPSDEALWGSHGKEILDALTSFSDMLPIAEDLGPVPPMVRPILAELGICSTRVMRWERLWEEGKSFVPIDQYPKVSMTTVSSHDSPTLTLWWMEYKDEARDFAKYKEWTYSPELTFAQRREILFDSNRTSSLFHINLLSEYLALFPELVSAIPQEERINVPGKVLESNWTYCLHLPLEDVLSHQGLKEELKSMIA